MDDWKKFALCIVVISVMIAVANIVCQVGQTSIERQIDYKPAIKSKQNCAECVKPKYERMGK